MTNLRNKLSARGIKEIRKPGRHADGGNLYLNVKPTGAKSWVFFYRFNGRQREIGLGSALDVSLAAARELGAECRSKVREGRDPLVERRKSADTFKTFGEVADAYIAAMTPSWRNEKHVAQWTMTLTQRAAPLRALDISKVETADVLAVLRPIWTKTPETASRLRGRIEAVLDSAKAQGLREGENPARWKGHLDHILPARQKLTRGHQEAMAYVDVQRFMDEVRDVQGTSAVALEFAVLTATRTSEVLGARWNEIDLVAGIWTIPANRMKAGKEHRVPLVGRALKILNDRAGGMADAYVFAGAKPGKPLSSMSLLMTLRRVKRDVTVHGFRSTFRDWASEQTDFPHEVQEMALAHVIKSSVERAYRRGDLLEKRRELMVAWDRLCCGSVL